MGLTDKKLTLAKSALYTLIIVLAISLSAEAIQRVRYFIRFRSAYWLLYGFTAHPKGYDAMHERGIERQLRGIEIIEIRNLQYDGYRKNNPAYDVGGNVNSFGFRGKEFDVKKKDGAYRIVTLGASTTFGPGVDDDSTYPVFLEKFLNSNSDGVYEVINAGVGSVTIREIANLFKKEVVPLAPDMVIVNSLINNLYYSANVSKYRANLPQKINRFLLSKSLFYMTLREKIAYLSRRCISDVYKAPVDTILANFMEDDSFWQRLKESYLDIAETAHANGIEVVIIKQPAWLHQEREANCGILLDKKLEPVYRKAYELFDEIAERENVESLDLASYFDAFPNKPLLFQADSLHLTAMGNERMARFIAQRLD